MATKMDRIGFPIQKDMKERLYDLRKLDKFKRCSISEILRILLEDALDGYDSTDDTKPA